MTSFHRVLTNPYYKGIVTMNGAQHAGSHEPLVSTTTWDTVQRLLEARRSGERSRIHTHYLKSTVYCLNCRWRLIVHKARSQSGRIYDYFVCSGRQSGIPRCTQSALPIANVERRVEGAYSTIEIDDRRLRKIKQAHQLRVALDADAREQHCVELDEQSTLLASHQAKLLDLYYSDGIARETLVREPKKLSQTLSRVSEEQTRLGEAAATAVRRVSALLELLNDAHARYLAAAPDARKQMNNALFNRVLIGPGDEDLRVELRDEIAEVLAE
ncbi:hypothetical protein F8O07_08595 [Pseudoclavibacter sp. CFCC 13796]|nr:hypothetical protein F8O07_08595 [Pseudoclavibacter sp. CFCC 13796]